MLDLILNPSAGGIQGEKILKALFEIETRLKERDVPYRVHYATIKGQTKELTEKLISEGATDLVIMGGDGTLHAAINGFHSFDKANMGIIPCGTGNDFAYALGIPKDPVKAIDLIIDGTPKYTDFMQMPTVRGLNVIGMGIDVEVLKKYSKLKKKTKWGYTKCLLKTIFKYRPFDFNCDLDGSTSEHNSIIAAVANGSVFGGGIPISPLSQVDDGDLDFIAVKGMNTIKLAFALIKLKTGKILKLKQTTHLKTKDVTVQTKQHCTVNVDGELYEDIPFQIKIVSNTLKIYR